MRWIGLNLSRNFITSLEAEKKDLIDDTSFRNMLLLLASGFLVRSLNKRMMKILRQILFPFQIVVQIWNVIIIKYYGSIEMFVEKLASFLFAL